MKHENEMATPAPMGQVDMGLGPLPKPFMELNKEIVPAVYAAWAAQMRAYAAEQVAAERERCRLAAHDAVMRALDEAGVYAQVLRGMCAEVAMERFSDELKA